MSTFGSRIKELRKEKQMTQKDLATFLNVSESTISLYESNKSEPDNQSSIKLANRFDVSLDYLLGRSNNPESFKNRKEKELNKVESDLLNIFRKLDKRGQHLINSIANYELNRIEEENIIFEQLEAEAEQINFDDIFAKEKTNVISIIDYANNKYKQVKPMYGKVSAGIGITPVQEYEEVGAPTKADFALIVEGDSMQPLYHDGDLIFIKETNSIDNNEIGVFILDTYPTETAYLKRYKRDGHIVNLISENKKYKNITVDLTQGEPFHLLGIVVDAIHVNDIV